MSKSENIERKFVESYDVSDWEIETDTGWEEISKSNKTVEYDVWELTTDSGKYLGGADNHIIFDEQGEELFIKDSLYKNILTDSGMEKVEQVRKLGHKEHMYDLTVNSANHRYYTNGILSHNTTIASCYLLWYAMFMPDSYILVASKTGADALDIMERIRYAYENLPDFIRAGVREYNKKTMRFDNGSVIVSTTTTGNTGRGKSITLIYLDEFAFVDPPSVAEELWTSLSPAISEGGKVMITSTPNSDQDTFAKLWFDSQEKYDEHGNKYPNDVGKNGFGSYFCTYKVHPTRDEEWARVERNKIGEARFRREHLSEFVVFEETLVNSVKLANMKPREPFKKSGQVRWFKKIKSNCSYVVSLDPCMGTGGDNAAITIWELPTMEQVGEWTHNETMIEGQIKLLRDILIEIWEQGNPEIYWSLESNTLGEAALVVLREIGTENFPGTFLSERKRDGGNRKRKGFTTTATNKRKSCARAKQWIESGALTVHSGALITELKNFIAKGNSYQAKTGCRDDLVSSMLVFIRMTEYIADWDEETNENISSYVDDDDGSSISPLPFIM